MNGIVMVYEWYINGKTDGILMGYSWYMNGI